MSDDNIDELGPVDYLVVEFPAARANFSGEMARELLALVDAKTIRVLDLIILRKDESGGIEALEIEDLDDAGDLLKLEAEIAEILAAEDIAKFAPALEPGSVAAVLVFENSWAAPFASSIRRSGGQLVANGRIPIQAIAAAFEADEALKEGA